MLLEPEMDPTAADNEASGREFPHREVNSTETKRHLVGYDAMNPLATMTKAEHLPKARWNG